MNERFISGVKVAKPISYHFILQVIGLKLAMASNDGNAHMGFEYPEHPDYVFVFVHSRSEIEGITKYKRNDMFRVRHEIHIDNVESFKEEVLSKLKTG